MEHGILLIHGRHSHLRELKRSMSSLLLYLPPPAFSSPIPDCCLQSQELHATFTTRTHPLHLSIFANLVWNISMITVVCRTDLYGQFFLLLFWVFRYYLHITPHVFSIHAGYMYFHNVITFPFSTTTRPIFFVQDLMYFDAFALSTLFRSRTWIARVVCNSC